MQNIATALFIGLGLIVVFLGWYVFSHRNKPVIIFHPEKRSIAFKNYVGFGNRPDYLWKLKYYFSFYNACDFQNHPPDL